MYLGRNHGSSSKTNCVTKNNTIPPPHRIATRDYLNNSIRLSDIVRNEIQLAAKTMTERNVTYDKARGIALKAALIPITNSLFAVGLVSLPGMMTGQILSGISPLVAVRYQIMVMCMLFSAVGLSSYLFLVLIQSKIKL